MAIEFQGIEIWIIGIIIAVAGYVIPQILLRKHPRSWAPEAKIISGVTVIAGIIIAFVTK